MLEQSATDDAGEALLAEKTLRMQAFMTLVQEPDSSSAVARLFNNAAEASGIVHGEDIQGCRVAWAVLQQARLRDDVQIRLRSAQRQALRPLTSELLQELANTRDADAALHPSSDTNTGPHSPVQTERTGSKSGNQVRKTQTGEARTGEAQIEKGHTDVGTEAEPSDEPDGDDDDTGLDREDTNEHFARIRSMALSALLACRSSREELGDAMMLLLQVALEPPGTELYDSDEALLDAAARHVCAYTADCDTEAFSDAESDTEFDADTDTE